MLWLQMCGDGSNRTCCTNGSARKIRSAVATSLPQHVVGVFGDSMAAAVDRYRVRRNFGVINEADVAATRSQSALCP